MIKRVASIELDRNDRARGEIWLTSTAEGEGFVVEVETPDGIESPDLPLFRDEQEARDGIEASWGRGPWDLQWDGELL